MLKIKKAKLDCEDILVDANKFFTQDLARQSDVSRLQNMMRKYSCLDPDKLEINRAKALNIEFKKIKQFK